MLTPKPCWATVCPALPIAPAAASGPLALMTLSLPTRLNATVPMPPSPTLLVMVLLSPLRLVMLFRTPKLIRSAPSTRTLNVVSPTPAPATTHEPARFREMLPIPPATVWVASGLVCDTARLPKFPLTKSPSPAITVCLTPLATAASEAIPPALVKLPSPTVTARFSRPPAAVTAEDALPRVNATPSRPSACASASVPKATAMLVAELVHCPPEPMPKNDKQVALAVGAARVAKAATPAVSATSGPGPAAFLKTIIVASRSRRGTALEAACR